MTFVVASTAVGELVRAEPRPARVVAVLPAAVYVEVLPPAAARPRAGGARGTPPDAAGWVALLARDAVRVPIGLVTALPRHRQPFGQVEVGAAASIGGGELRLAAAGDHTYRPLRYWDPTVPRLCGALATAPVARRAEALAMLAAGLPADDLRDWSERAEVLERALAPATPAPGALAEAALALAGLGPGLTPAGDDVLAGCLVTLAAAADEPRRLALVHAVHEVLPRTTPISAALLDQACHGRAVPQVGALLRALAGSGDLDAALAALAQVGHTSGAALALGMRAALRARYARLLGAVRVSAAGEATAVKTVEVRPGAYHDSVTLMQVSRAVAGVPGVLAAQVAMGTDLNLEVLAGMGFTVPAGAGPADLLVAVRAVDAAAQAAAGAALAAALAPVRGTSPAGDGAVPHRTSGAAVRQAGGDGTLVLISTPGAYAFVEAMDALEAGADVLVFSDNVPVEQEVRLKDVAAERGRLVMGPDCGTAVVGGVGLGFANVVRPGRVGLVAASGTGSQQLMSLLDAAGVGVRHCLGVGGRDLSAAVGGRSTRQALALLDADPDVDLIVVVSKPPAAEVEAAVRAVAATLATPVQFALLGAGRPDLTEAARAAVGAAGGTWRELPWWPPSGADGPGTRPPRAPRTRLRAAFAGGTLCDEAMIVAGPLLGPVASNIPLPGAPRLGPDLRTADDGSRPPHVMIDFGDDELTRGRPHPMIDGSLRLEWLAREASQVGAGEGAVVLLDVVLGHAAHPDPAAELAPAILAARAGVRARGGELAVVVSLCGTQGDPQGLRRQAEALAAAGAAVHLSNAQAARAALTLLTGATLLAGGTLLTGGGDGPR